MRALHSLLVSWKLIPVAVLIVAIAACTSIPVAVSSLDSVEIVDCELPGPILRVGAGYATTGRATAVRAGADECAARGGAYVTPGRASYETSLKVWLPLAADGDKQAQTYVGTIYEKGLGRAPDFTKAAEWYQKAASQNFPAAQTALATLYERGLIGRNADGRPDAAAALLLYRQAAQLNEALVFQSEVVNRDKEIAALKAELERSRTESKKISEDLSRERTQLNSKIDSLRRELTAARVVQDQERIRRFEKELREREEESKVSAVKISSAETSIANTTIAIASLEKDSPANDPNNPQIQLIEPMSIAMRGITTVRVRGGAREIPVVARITAKAKLTQVYVNDKLLTPDAEGIVRSLVAVTGKTTAVQIIALDANGKRASLPFVMATGDIIPEATRTAGPARANGGFGNYYALVIGNANYKYWESLNTPPADAQAVSQVLDKKYGFKVTMLLDASRSRIFREIAKLRSTLTENDNLLIYYSGHGQWDSANQKGYWVPVDGEKDNAANYISSSDITEQLSAVRARQVLVVADACYAGVLVRSVAEQLDKTNANKTDWLMSRAQLQSRKVMSSGGVKQVMDGGAGKHSIFARQFLDGLSRKMEAFEAHELYRDIAPRVEAAAKGFGEQQQPQYGQLRFSGHVGGDFVFVPRV